MNSFISPACYYKTDSSLHVSSQHRRWFPCERWVAPSEAQAQVPTVDHHVVKQLSLSHAFHLSSVMYSWLKDTSLETGLWHFMKENVWSPRNQPLFDFTQGCWGTLNTASWFWRRNLISETNLLSVPLKNSLLFPLFLYTETCFILVCFMCGRTRQQIQWFLCTANGSCCLRGVGIHFLLMPIITCLETHHLQVRELKSWEVNRLAPGHMDTGPRSELM